MSLKRKINIYLDGIIYKLSWGNLILEKIKYKLWFILKKSDYKSDFNPIIIGGCPRSGTTLARALLSVHPDVAIPEKEYNLLVFIKEKKVLGESLGLSEQEIEDIKSKYDDYFEYAESLVKQYTKKQGKKRFGVKLPNNILIIETIHKYYPKMKFIHVIRDGRDAACSLRTHPKRKIVKGKIVPIKTNNPFKWCVRRWAIALKIGDKWANSKNYIEVKYEDLVNNTVEEMEKIFDFLELGKIPKEKILSFYQTQNDIKHPQNVEVGKPIYQKTIGRWKNDMTPKEKKLFKKMAGNLLIKKGYEKDFDW